MAMITGQQRKNNVELFQLNLGEGRAMPARRCPYCKTMSNFDLGEQITGGHLEGRFVSLDTCQHCGTPVYFSVPSQQDRESVIDSYPKLDINISEELSKDVEVAFGEAIKSLDEGNWNACVLMCRRALDEAMENLDAAGKDLFKKIDDLAKKGKITADLKKWAHENRLASALAAHGSPDKKWSDQQDAEEMVEFCRWFFQYIYVLPQQLAESKTRLTQGSPEDS
jgi:hypothetical protein